MTVDREDLERHLDRLASRMGDKRAGLYGPGTLSWEVNREGIIMLGGGCAALLQLAHPFVAHAVDQHSHTREDPLGRFQRTFANVFAMVFGDLEQALTAARRVHALHQTIRGAIREDVGRFRRGARYRANDERALLWVHATLLDTALKVFERIVRPLSPLEREAYYAESRLFSHLFGIPDRVVPPTWSEFESYFEEMIASETIAVGAPALEMRRFLFRGTTRAHRPFVAWFEAFTASLLPPKLRHQLELPYGARERAVMACTEPGLRLAYRAAPPRVRFFPAYIEACRRIEGRPQPDHLGRWLEHLMMRGLAPTRAARPGKTGRSERVSEGGPELN